MSRLAITVRYDGDFGEAKRVVMAPQFKRESALMRADVLTDIIAMVELLRIQAVAEMQQEFANARAVKAQRHGTIQ